MKFYVLEWNGLDDNIDLYEWPTEKNDIAEVWEEAAEDLHNFSSILVMDSEQLGNLFQAVSNFQKEQKGGEQDNG